MSSKLTTVTLSVRLVPRGFAAVADPRAIPARAVPFVWSTSEGGWRSVEPLFVAAAKREGEGAFHAVSELSDSPFYHVALRVGGSIEETTATLQRRLDTEQLVLVAPKRWACADCQRSLRRKEEPGPCGRHAKEMPPAVLYRTRHPRVNRQGRYYVFGYASDFESTTPLREHNDEPWHPAIEEAAANEARLQAAVKAEQAARERERAADEALSPAEQQAAFERALYGSGGSSAE